MGADREGHILQERSIVPRRRDRAIGHCRTVPHPSNPLPQLARKPPAKGQRRRLSGLNVHSQRTSSELAGETGVRSSAGKADFTQPARGFPTGPGHLVSSSCLLQSDTLGPRPLTVFGRLGRRPPKRPELATALCTVRTHHRARPSTHPARPILDYRWLVVCNTHRGDPSIPQTTHLLPTIVDPHLREFTGCGGCP
jgi:hypothetical protein